MSAMTRIFSLSLCLAVPAAVFAQSPGPCDQIVNACKSAGFVVGDAREGYGLYDNCFFPIINQTKPPAKTDKTLPTISPQVAAACKVRRQAEEAKK
jgi:hypothetical protein